LGGQAGFVNPSVPVHCTEERSFGDRQNLHPSFDRPYRAGDGRCRAVLKGETKASFSFNTLSYLSTIISGT
jgi:hypothetical protein